MRVLNLRLASGLAALVVVSATVSSASAEVRNFTIDSALSSLSFSADVLNIDPDPSVVFQTQSQLNFAPLPSFTDGTITSYAGNIQATVTPSAVTLVGGSLADAAISGFWVPLEGGGPIVPGIDPTLGGTNVQPGDYAFTLDGIVWSALRDFQLDLVSGALPRTGGTFNSANAYFPVLSGSLSNTSVLNDIAGVLGSIDLTGAPLGSPIIGGSNPGGIGTITPFGSSGLTITVPIDVTQPLPLGELGEEGNPDDPLRTVIANLRITGTLTAVSIPEPGSVALAAIGLVGLAGLVARRRRG